LYSKPPQGFFLAAVDFYFALSPAAVLAAFFAMQMTPVRREIIFRAAVRAAHRIHTLEHSYRQGKKHGGGEIEEYRRGYRHYHDNYCKRRNDYAEHNKHSRQQQKQHRGNGAFFPSDYIEFFKSFDAFVIAFHSAPPHFC
jgi:hypothetical protein